VCLLGHLDAQVEHKGDDGEVTLSFSFHGPALDQAIAELGSPPLPPYIAPSVAPDRARPPRDYQTIVRGQRGRGGGPRQRACILHPRCKRRCGNAVSDALLGPLHVGAGTFLPVIGGGHRRAQDSLI